MKDASEVIEAHKKSDNFLVSPLAKAQRLKRVRNLANLSREELCADGEINIATLISWEVGRFNGLTKKGAQRVIKRVAKEGVYCTLDWLIYEIGPSPVVRTNYKESQKQIQNTVSNQNQLNEKERIIEELLLFRTLNPNTIDYIVEDEAMAPQYNIGDYIAGTKRFTSKIKSLIGYDCIVQTKEGLILVRNLQPGPREISFNLIATNLQTKARNVLLYDVELVSAAPIIWHRRFEP
jgi:hypothetical protein